MAPQRGALVMLVLLCSVVVSMRPSGRQLGPISREPSPRRGIPHHPPPPEESNEEELDKEWPPAPRSLLPPPEFQDPSQALENPQAPKSLLPPRQPNRPKVACSKERTTQMIPAYRKPNVALCLSGQLRYFQYIASSIVEYLIKYLSMHSKVVHIYLSSFMSETSHHVFFFLHEIKRASQELKNIQLVTVHMPFQYPNAHEVLPSNGKSGADGTSALFNLTGTCNELILKGEDDYSVTYDTIIRTRLDGLWSELPHSMPLAFGKPPPPEGEKLKKIEEGLQGIQKEGNNLEEKLRKINRTLKGEEFKEIEDELKELQEERNNLEKRIHKKTLREWRDEEGFKKEAEEESERDRIKEGEERENRENQGLEREIGEEEEGEKMGEEEEEREEKEGEEEEEEQEEDFMMGEEGEEEEDDYMMGFPGKNPLIGASCFYNPGKFSFNGLNDRFGVGPRDVMLKANDRFGGFELLVSKLGVSHPLPKNSEVSLSQEIKQHQICRRPLTCHNPDCSGGYPCAVPFCILQSKIIGPRLNWLGGPVYDRGADRHQGDGGKCFLECSTPEECSVVANTTALAFNSLALYEEIQAFNLSECVENLRNSFYDLNVTLSGDASIEDACLIRHKNPGTSPGFIRANVAWGDYLKKNTVNPHQAKGFFYRIGWVIYDFVTNAPYGMVTNPINPINPNQTWVTQASITNV